MQAPMEALFESLPAGHADEALARAVSLARLEARAVEIAFHVLRHQSSSGNDSAAALNWRNGTVLGLALTSIFGCPSMVVKRFS